ncbi:MAG TPA: enoyl-CoA hydratase-related protein [Gemmatimonadales bacterium]|nr:enoyl-CoA hydratase-related protein [Gemmatimonadales bacterium]
MAGSLVTLDGSEGIFTLTLRRSDALNALSIELCGGVLDALARVDQDPGARALIVTGEGRAFSAGADLKEREGATPEAIWAHNRRIFQIPLELERMAVPTIAAINGFALGGGCEVALGCDLRWAASTSEFGCPEVTRGIVPAAGGTQRLPRLVGGSRAMALILSGRRISAREAYRIGLVDAVVPPEDLSRAVGETARIIAANAPLAVRAAKRAIRHGLGTTLEAGLELEGQLQRMLYATADSQEGIVAFRERRPPRWAGR